MIRPDFLNPHDTIGLVAPANKVNIETLQNSFTIFEQWSWKLKFSEHLWATHHRFAGMVAQRQSDLQTMLDDPHIKAIFCARGGYGTLQLIDQLNWEGFIKKPKWVVGFSDITVLLAQINNLGIESLHGPMPYSFSTTLSEHVQYIHQILTGHLPVYNTAPHPLNKIGKTKGELIGGNLCMLHNLIGTPTQINTTQKILFIEDVGEYLYNIERMMLHLDRSGLLKNLGGLIVGQFSRMKTEEPTFGMNVYQIIDQLISKYSFPVCYDFPLGHEQENLPLICGRKSLLEITTTGVRLSFEL